jgi:hypothetical protein
MGYSNAYEIYLQPGEVARGKASRVNASSRSQCPHILGAPFCIPFTDPMSHSLADLFSASSPPASPYRGTGYASRTPSPQRLHNLTTGNPLFLSPTSTAATPLVNRKRAFQPAPERIPISASRLASGGEGSSRPNNREGNENNALDGNGNGEVFDLGWDPLAGLAGVGAADDEVEENTNGVKKRRIIPKIDSDRSVPQPSTHMIITTPTAFNTKHVPVAYSPIVMRS